MGPTPPSPFLSSSSPSSRMAPPLTPLPVTHASASLTSVPAGYSPARASRGRICRLCRAPMPHPEPGLPSIASLPLAEGSRCPSLDPPCPDGSGRPSLEVQHVRIGGARWLEVGCPRHAVHQRAGRQNWAVAGVGEEGGSGGRRRQVMRRRRHGCGETRMGKVRCFGRERETVYVFPIFFFCI